MLCWKCGAQIDGNFCMICGCNLSTRRNPQTIIGKNLRYACDKFGIEQLLNDSCLLGICANDLLYDETEIRQQIKLIMANGFGHELLDTLRRNKQLDSVITKVLMQKIVSLAGISETDARTLLDGLLDMVGVEYTLSTADAPQKPIVHEDKPIRPTTDGSADVKFHWPESDDGHQNAEKPLGTLYGINLMDTTFGGPSRVNAGGVLYVYGDRLQYHLYHTGGKMASILGKTIAGKKAAEYASCEEQPQITIRINTIKRIDEEDFLSCHDLTIILHDETHFRIYGVNTGKNAMKEIAQLIRSLIA